jgi:hypothetical protein
MTPFDAQLAIEIAKRDTVLEAFNESHDDLIDLSARMPAAGDPELEAAGARFNKASAELHLAEIRVGIMEYFVAEHRAKEERIGAYVEQRLKKLHNSLLPGLGDA